MVCAVVFKVRIAAMGTSISRLKRRKRSPARDLPSASICAWLTVSSTASEMEQTNDDAIASTPAKMKPAMVSVLGRGFGFPAQPARDGHREPGLVVGGQRVERP